MTFDDLLTYLLTLAIFRGAFAPKKATFKVDFWHTSLYKTFILFKNAPFFSHVCILAYEQYMIFIFSFLKKISYIKDLSKFSPHTFIFLKTNQSSFLLGGNLSGFLEEGF